MTPPPEAPTVTLPMSTFLTANGVPREWFVAASGAFATWLEQLGPDNTAPAALLHTLETLRRVQGENAELRARIQRLVDGDDL